MKTLITALLAISVTSAFAGSYSATATGVAEISASGAYQSSSTVSSLYLEGGTDSVPSYGVIDFSTAGLGISGSVTALTFAATSFGTPTAGNIHFYTTTDTTVNSGTGGLVYSTGTGTTNGVQNSQFNNSIVDLGVLAYSVTGANTFTLTINSAAQAALASEIAAGDIRILMTADSASTSALYSKFDGISTSYPEPTLSITTQPAPEPVSTAIILGALGTAIAKRRKRA